MYYKWQFINQLRAIKRSLSGRSLCSVRLFQSVVPSSVPQTLHSTKKYSSLKISSYIFSAVRSSSSHGLFLRSVGLMHPQYSFIPLQSFVRLTLHCITLKALSFLSLHSSRIMSAALSVFSGCSFAQPSGLAPFGKNLTLPLIKERLRLTFIFSPPLHAAIPTLHFAIASFHSRSSVAVRLPQHRHCAPRKANNFRLRYNHLFFCGAWGCSISTTICFHKK